MINTHSISNMDQVVKKMIFNCEGIDPEPTKNIGDNTITYGYGYTFIRKGSDGWATYENLDSDLAAIGIELSASQRTQLDAIARALTQNNLALADQLITQFQQGWEYVALTEPEAQTLYNLEINRKKDELATQFRSVLGTTNGNALLSGLQNTNELVCLLDMAYNGGAGLVGSNLINAMWSGDRLRAWFEVRYKSNGGESLNQGIANRRYAESDLFGLWDGNTPTQTELDKFASFIDQKDPYGSNLSILQLIRNYEADYNPHARTDINSNRIDETINSSAVKSYFVTKYALGNPIDGSVILGTELSNTVITSSRTLTKSEIKAGYLESTANNDLILGGKGNDLIDGGAGNDVIYGGEGDDKLYGRQGNDTLLGGAGNDSYYVEANEGIDTIEDKQGNNKLFICGKLISYFYWDPNISKYRSLIDSNIVGVKSGTEFIITAEDGVTQVKLNEDFQWGDFGINLINTPTNPVTDNPITGDLTPVDFDPNTDGIQTQKDQWGNIITDPNQPSPGRADTLYDTSGNDSIVGGAGDDNIYTVHGGSNRIQGGDGNDNITQYTGDVGTRGTLLNSIIEGGAGSDIILGHYTVSNQLFGDSYGDMATLIAAGETAPNIDGRGDFISDYYLPEYGQTSSTGYLYGSNSSDILINNTGVGLIVGGGGDDLIYGDFDGHINANNNNTWAYTIDITTDENGNTAYTSNITGIDVTDNTAQGAGNDMMMSSMPGQATTLL